MEESDCATNRAATSVGPPAGNGTTILMVRSGYPSARLGWIDTMMREAANTASSEAATPRRWTTASRIAAHANSIGAMLLIVRYAQAEQSALRYAEGFCSPD